MQDTKIVFSRWKTFKKQQRLASESTAGNAGGGESGGDTDDDVPHYDKNEAGRQVRKSKKQCRIARTISPGSAGGGETNTDKDDGVPDSKKKKARGQVPKSDKKKRRIARAASSGNDGPSVEKKTLEQTSSIPTGPEGKLLIVQHPTTFSINLDEWTNNSCHWNSMLPVFIAILQAKLLPDPAEVTDQARGYFTAVRKVSSGMHTKMGAEIKVSDSKQRSEHCTIPKWIMP